MHGRVAAARVNRLRLPVRNTVAFGKRGLKALQELEEDEVEEEVLIGVNPQTCSQAFNHVAIAVSTHMCTYCLSIICINTDATT